MKPLFFLFIIISLFIISNEQGATCEQFLEMCKNTCTFRKGFSRQLCESGCTSEFFRCIKNRKKI